MKELHLEGGETTKDIGDDTTDLKLYGELTMQELCRLKTKKIKNLDLGNVTNTKKWKNITLIAFPANKPGTVYTIGNSVLKIGSHAFDSSLLLAISFQSPVALNEIGEYAFCNCSLETVTIPRSVTKVGAWCFNCAKSLVSAAFEEGISILKIPA